MTLIAVAADKGAPGVTTASVALAAVWPRPVLLAECDAAGGDLVYRLPSADGGRLDPGRGLLSLAVAARRGLQPHQVWEHTQKLHGGLDVLTGVSGAEQGAGLELLWGPVGRLLAAVPQADVIADCGRIGVDGPPYDLLAQARTVILLSRASLGDVIRLRDRVSAVAAAVARRGQPAGRVDVVLVTDYKNFGAATAEVAEALRRSGAPGRVLGGLAYEPKSADQLRGQWSGKLDKSMFIRTVRAIAGDLVSALPEPPADRLRSAGASARERGIRAPAPQKPDLSGPGPQRRAAQPLAAAAEQPRPAAAPRSYDAPRSHQPSARSGRAAARGRHAGTAAGQNANDQQPPERGDAPEPGVLASLAEPASEPASGRAPGRPGGS
jgi:hypothetical protein